MTPNSGEESSGGLSPDDAFRILGSEVRIEILQALCEAHDPYADDNTVPFSALYEQIGYDDTGNFNYQLGKLTDHFVRQSDEGYELAETGFRIVRAVIAGATEDPTMGPAAVDVPCLRCGGAVEMTYEDGIVWARCTECVGLWPQQEGELIGFGLPPNGLDTRTPEEVLNAAITYSLRQKETLRDGVCPDCGGTVDASLDVCENHNAGDGICDACGTSFLGTITYTCRSCKYAFRTPSWDPVHHHPALIAFYHDRGIDHAHDSWSAMRRSFQWHEELLSSDPPRIRIIVPHEGDELHVTLNEVGSVVNTSVNR
jgi:hypothetical protein